MVDEGTVACNCLLRAGLFGLLLYFKVKQYQYYRVDKPLEPPVFLLRAISAFMNEKIVLLNATTMIK